MGKNVAVFVDVANIFYAAKAAGVDIDYVTLLKSATAGRDLVRAYAYTGLDPDNENQRNFHSFLARSNYKVVSKDIRKYGDGKVKANLDIELVVDMMKTARNLDIAIVVSGDGDFAPAIRAVQEMGVRCEVISFRGNTSSDLIEVADLFTDITQLAKVEKGSRSGRRVAEDDQDLSMTEVPDKQTEGTGRGRGRGRGRDRDRDRSPDREPVAASSGLRGRSRRTPVVAAPENGTGVVALPGERLSRAVIGGLTEADLARAEVFTLDDVESPDVLEPAAPVLGGEDRDDETFEDGQRRRRRRGGRGRGRGRGRDAEGGELAAVGAEAPLDATVDADADVDEDVNVETQDEEAPAPARPAAAARPVRRVQEDEPAEEPRRPRSTPFGSVWDSQLGTSTPAPSSLTPIAPLPEEEWDDEPEIPEYLIAERNRGARGGAGGRGGRPGGARGGRAAYQDAVQRERFGRGGGGGGINRYPNVSERPPERSGNRDAGPAPRRDDRGPRPERAPAPAAPRGGGEWSEVPPELEELLRAQLGQRPEPRAGGRPATSAPTSQPVATEPEAAPPAAAPADEVEEAAIAASAATRRRASTRRSPAETPAVADGSTDAAADEAPAPRRRASTRKTAPSDDASSTAAAPATGEDGTEPAPARRTARRSTRTAATADAPEAASEAAEAPTPRRRSTKAAADAAVVTDGGTAEEAAPAPKRRTTRRTATTEPA